MVLRKQDACPEPREERRRLWRALRKVLWTFVGPVLTKRELQAVTTALNTSPTAVGVKRGTLMTPGLLRRSKYSQRVLKPIAIIIIVTPRLD